MCQSGPSMSYAILYAYFIGQNTPWSRNHWQLQQSILVAAVVTVAVD